MNKLAYAVVCSTALVMCCFAPRGVDRFFCCAISAVFAVFCVLGGGDRKP